MEKVKQVKIEDDYELIYRSTLHTNPRLRRHVFECLEKTVKLALSMFTMPRMYGLSWPRFCTNLELKRPTSPNTVSLLAPVTPAQVCCFFFFCRQWQPVVISDQWNFRLLARALSDEELEEICRSQDRPEKERLILRKRHQYPTHEEFKRKGTITQKRNQIQKMYEETLVPWAPAMGSSGTPSPIGAYASLQPLHHGLPDRQQTVDIITSIGNGMSKGTPPVSGKPSSDTTSSSYFPSLSERSNEPIAIPASQQSSNWDQKAPTTPHSGGTSVSSRFSVASFNSAHAAYRSHTPKLRQFFGERPPSEVISSNLPSFFPNHKPEILETAGINAKRMSMRRASQSSGISTSRHRDSVLPELASVLGLELDEVFEQEELEALQAEEEDTDYEVEEEDEFRPPAELKLPTTFPQKMSLQNKRYSTLLTIKSDGDVESHMPARKSSLINTDTTLADKATQQSKVMATSPPVSASTTLQGTPMEAPEVLEIPSPEPSPTEPSPTEPTIQGKLFF
jgi:hypothetical protein